MVSSLAVGTDEASFRLSNPGSRLIRSKQLGAWALRKRDHLPFLLGERLATIPSKIVKKIGDFVDMAGLLRDNIEAECRANVGEGLQFPKTAQGARCEIPDLLSWVQCFGIFCCCNGFLVECQLLAYQTFIIRGVVGWVVMAGVFMTPCLGSKLPWTAQ